MGPIYIEILFACMDAIWNFESAVKSASTWSTITLYLETYSTVIGYLYLLASMGKIKNSKILYPFVLHSYG